MTTTSSLAVTHGKLEQHEKAIFYFKELYNKDSENEELLSCLAYEYQSLVNMKNLFTS